MDFIVGGTAACCAGLFTNPFDLIKTRQQLQGELTADRTLKNPYSSVLKSIRSIVQKEGVLGLQKGLVSALAFQFVMNSTRLGLYQTVDTKGFTRGDDGNHNPLLCVFWGAVSGVAGSALGAPLYKVKCQLQSQSNTENAVGYQHKHKNMGQALMSIFKETGVKGLWAGSSGLLIRTSVGSATQLSTFTECKDFLQRSQIFRESVFLTAVGASMISGFFTVVCMTPFDVIATRLFNQGVDERGRGLLYRNIFDCFTKTFRTEGLRGLYKGFFPNYCRAAPHTVLNLTFWEFFKNIQLHLAESD
ncbi:solute carrier family 25 member 35 [Sergentomyia squamirostris]